MWIDIQFAYTCLDIIWKIHNKSSNVVTFVYVGGERVDGRQVRQGNFPFLNHVSALLSQKN